MRDCKQFLSAGHFAKVQVSRLASHRREFSGVEGAVRAKKAIGVVDKSGPVKCFAIKKKYCNFV